jgi:hypothetical protein
MPQQKHFFRAIKTTALILAAVTPLYIGSLQWGGSINTEVISLGIWLVSPYVGLFIVMALLERFSDIKTIVGINCVVALLILAFTIWAYTIALDETSDTGHLIFLFGPAWVCIVSFFLLGFTLLFMKLARKET